MISLCPHTHLKAKCVDSLPAQVLSIESERPSGALSEISEARSSLIGFTKDSRSMLFLYTSNSPAVITKMKHTDLSTDKSILTGRGCCVSRVLTQRGLVLNTSIREKNLSLIQIIKSWRYSIITESLSFTVSTFAHIHILDILYILCLQ